MRNRYLFYLIIISLFSTLKVSAQKQKTGTTYILSWIDQVIKDKENGDDTENYLAVFANGKDTVVVYKWYNKEGGRPLTINFWAAKGRTNDAVSFLSSEGANIKVTFLKGQKIQIDSDLYEVNKLYYNFLKQRLLVERSVLDFAFFIKDGYGDYAVSLEPLLQKNWRNQRETAGHRIIGVVVKNKNEQTDDQFHVWNAVYSYTANGVLQRIKGEFYNKKLISNSAGDIAYLVEKNLDRSYVKIKSTQNKKTLLDSIAVSWTQFSNSKEFQYSKYQSKLRQLSLGRKPKNFDEAAKFLKIEIAEKRQ